MQQQTINIADQIHQKAIEISTRYRKAESELIEILQQVEQYRVFLRKGHSSLFLYVVKELGLSESVAYNLISVSRKAREMPELKTEIQKGVITLSNARKIVPILNRDNKIEWLKKAAELSQRQLEKEMMRLRRVQDLLSQSRNCAVTLEQVIATLTQDYLKRHDPIEKANRRWIKKGFANQTETVKTPVSLQAERCNQTRWIKIHHKIPVSRGGKQFVTSALQKIYSV